MYEFWYDYLIPKYGENVKLCYMDADGFIVHVETDDIYKDIVKYAEKIFVPSNYEIDKALPKRKKKKIIGIMKDELGRQIMKEFVGLRAKTYSHLIDDRSENKKAKGTKKWVIKREIRFQDYKNCLNNAKIDGKLKY